MKRRAIKRRSMKLRPMKPMDGQTSLLAAALVVGAVGVLTLVLRKTVGDYVAEPLGQLYSFLRSLIDVLPQRTQAIVFVIVASLASLLAFLPSKTVAAPVDDSLIRSTRTHDLNSPLNRWSAELAQFGHNRHVAETLADSLRDLIVASNGGVEFDDPPPAPVRAILAGTPKWLLPAPLKWWEDLRPLQRRRRVRLRAITSEQAYPQLVEVISFLRRLEGLDPLDHPQPKATT